jgi:hypothetical protein
VRCLVLLGAAFYRCRIADRLDFQGEIPMKMILVVALFFLTATMVSSLRPAFAAYAGAMTGTDYASRGYSKAAGPQKKIKTTKKH